MLYFFDTHTFLMPFCDVCCAGVDSVDCTGLNTVIPGKTKLPLSHLVTLHCTWHSFQYFLRYRKQPVRKV